MAETIKYKCSKCGIIGEAIREIHFACPACGAEMLQFKEETETKADQKKTNDLPVAKVVSLGFFDLLPIPAGSRLDIFKQKLLAAKFTDITRTKDTSPVFKQLSEITHNPINDDIPGNYKRQKLKYMVKVFFLLGIFIILILLLWFI